MDMTITDAKAHLTELVRRAEAGEEVVLTRRGRPAVRLVPVQRRTPTDPAERAAIIREIVAEAQREVLPGPNAARSQDFLYDEDGLPK